MGTSGLPHMYIRGMRAKGERITQTTSAHAMYKYHVTPSATFVAWPVTLS